MKAAFLTIVAGLVAGCAGTGGQFGSVASTSDCIFTSTIQDWRPLDDQNLIIYAAGRQPYHVELSRTCFNLEFSDVIAFYDRSVDERICGYGMDRIIVDRSMPESCGIAGVREISEAQAESLLIEYDQAEAAPQAGRVTQ